LREHHSGLDFEDLSLHICTYRYICACIITVSHV